MLFKPPKYRSFDYTPRFYKPEEDEEEKRKRRLGFRTVKPKQRKKGMSLFVMVALLILAVLFFLKLGTYQ